MSTQIHERDDVNLEHGQHEHGEVTFADTVNKKYPIDTPEHIRAAWDYIHHKDNAAKYKPDEVETIKKRIEGTAKKHDIMLHDEA